MSCREVIIKREKLLKEIGVCDLIVRNSGNTAKSKFGYDMILVQGPSCLFSAVIEKPFFPSSRQVTIFDGRHDEHTCFRLPNISRP